MKPCVFIIGGDIWHPAETVRRGLAPLCAGGFDFEFLAAGARCPGKIPADYSVVMLARANLISTTDGRPWLTPDATAALHDHLRRGNGLIAIHAGTSRYERSPGMTELIGGRFVRHPDPCAVKIEPRPGHALTSGVTGFTVRDEHYFMNMNDTGADIFLHSRSEHGLQPAGWTRSEEGGGRVCVLTPGHNLEVWRHPEFQKLLLNALRWTAKLN